MYFLFNGSSDGGDCHGRYIEHMRTTRAAYRERLLLAAAVNAVDGAAIAEYGTAAAASLGGR